MRIATYALGAVAAAAVLLVMSLASCSDKPTEPAATRLSYNIAFISERDGVPGVFSMDNNGSGLKRLTHGAVGPSVSWSPDGSMVAFTSRGIPYDNVFDIFVVRADGSFPTRLTFSTHFMGEIGAVPIWSPDGSKMAFRSDRDGNSDIFIMNSDGSSLTNVTHDSCHNYDPVWRPDGLGVTFVSASGNDDSGEYWLHYSNPDGSVRVFEQVQHGNWHDSLCALVWFPVGSTLGYVSFQQYGGAMASHVCTWAPGHTSCTERLIRGAGAVDHVISPVWSPDGSRLAFVSNAEGRRNIYVITIQAEPGDPQRLTNSLTGEGAAAPAWSPDGTEIVFAADWTGNSEIYVMKADGTGVRQLTTSSGSAYPACTKGKR